jgi:hypothetical protein
VAKGRKHETILVVTIKRCATKSIILQMHFFSDVTFALEESRWVFMNRILENGWDLSFILWITTWLTCI